MSGCRIFALNDLFIGIQTSILLFFFLFFFFAWWSHLPAYSTLLTHRSVNFCCLLTMPHSRSQITWEECLIFPRVCPALFRLHRQATSTLYFRSRCIWWDLNGASSDTCDFTSCWFSQQDHPVLPRAFFVFLPSALSSVCHVKQESSTSSTKMSDESYSHHW